MAIDHVDVRVENQGVAMKLSGAGGELRQQESCQKQGCGE
jgi:hypothetical protein